jgi:hypothetical protein
MSAELAKQTRASARLGRGVRGITRLGRRLLRFRLSTLPFLMVVVAILLSWKKDRARLRAEIEKLRNPNAGWGVQQATGPPDTTGYGDINTAWASKGQDDRQEWLELDFPQAVVPHAVWIYETYNPGAVVKVSRIGMLGIEEVLWEGTDPTPAGAQGGISKISLGCRTPVSRLKVYLDSPAVPGWNEIDAIGLVYGKNQIQWAESARASTAYSGSPEGPANDSLFVW